MIVERPQLVNLGCAVYFRASALDILQVLAATRVRAEDRRDERKRLPDTVGPHLTQRVGKQGMPIAIAPIDGKLQAVARQFALQPCDQRTVLIVDRALASEMIIMFGDG